MYEKRDVKRDVCIWIEMFQKTYIYEKKRIKTPMAVCMRKEISKETYVLKWDILKEGQIYEKTRIKTTIAWRRRVLELRLWLCCRAGTPNLSKETCTYAKRRQKWRTCTERDVKGDGYVCREMLKQTCKYGRRYYKKRVHVWKEAVQKQKCLKRLSLMYVCEKRCQKRRIYMKRDVKRDVYVREKRLIQQATVWRALRDDLFRQLPVG